jgi:lysophospholipase L1-like esterase
MTGGHVSSAARDGAVIASITEQLARRPPDATHIVVSAGGNDALQSSDILDERLSSMGAALETLARVAENFRRQYARLLHRLASTGLPVAVCTIYDPRFPDGRLRRIGATALSVLNDAITREAFVRRFALIDLRLVCERDEDFANPIEPSAAGGAKIARAIANFAKQVSPSALVFASGNT